jgi:hypothetical protein
MLLMRDSCTAFSLPLHIVDSFPGCREKSPSMEQIAGLLIGIGLVALARVHHLPGESEHVQE